MKVGFFNHQLDIRGTGNAVFDYAHYNEELLGNDSLIITTQHGKHHPAMVQKVGKRFGGFWTIEDLGFGRGLPEFDVLYHIKSGGKDDAWQLGEDFLPPSMKYVVHAVFNGSPIKCDVLATISEWMGDRYNIPYVPHIVHLPEHTDNLRKDLGIPEDAWVWGRHGGPDTFDIDFVWRAINRALLDDESLWFVFMNTDLPPGVTLADTHRVRFVEPTANAFHKRAFINTCDGMLHARSRGETFGIAVGEFAFCDKLVLTYGNSPEQAHIKELGLQGVHYRDEDELVELLLMSVGVKVGAYQNFLPETVMNKFQEVFLA